MNEKMINKIQIVKSKIINKYIIVFKKIEWLFGIYPIKICPYCGYKKIERISKYCNMCGKKLK